MRAFRELHNGFMGIRADVVSTVVLVASLGVSLRLSCRGRTRADCIQQRKGQAKGPFGFPVSGLRSGMSAL